MAGRPCCPRSTPTSTGAVSAESSVVVLGPPARRAKVADVVRDDGPHLAATAASRTKSSFGSQSLGRQR